MGPSIRFGDLSVTHSRWILKQSSRSPEDIISQNHISNRDSTAACCCCSRRTQHPIIPENRNNLQEFRKIIFEPGFDRCLDFRYTILLRPPTPKNGRTEKKTTKEGPQERIVDIHCMNDVCVCVCVFKDDPSKYS